MCTTIYWTTRETPPRATIYTVWDLADLCNYYGRDLYEMLFNIDSEIDVHIDDNDSCLCPLGDLDMEILLELGIDFNTHDDGSISIIEFPPIPTQAFEVLT